MGNMLPPTEAFTALLKRYENQRRCGTLPNGLFLNARQISWVNVHTPTAELEAPAHRPLTDGELSALAGKPVFDVRIAPTPHGPRQVNWKLSKAGAREHWAEVKRELQGRMGVEMWNRLESPRDLREDHGIELSAYSFALDMKDDPNFPPPPPLPEDHPLFGYKIPMEWPDRKRRQYISDISVIRIHPTNFGPRHMWEHLCSLSPNHGKMLYMPRQDNTYIMLQGHEQGHTMQPQASRQPHKQSYYGEYHADKYMSGMVLRLGVHPGHVDAWEAARAITSQAFTGVFGSNTWSCHSVAPAIYFGGFNAWPVEKLNAMRRQVRAYTDLLIVGEDCNLTAEEILALSRRDRKFFAQYDGRKEEVERQLARAKLAEARVESKPTLKVEMRLLAMKKLWNDPRIKMDKEMLFTIGHTLEAAALFWPGINEPSTKLTPRKCATFRPRNRAPAAT